MQFIPFPSLSPFFSLVLTVSCSCVYSLSFPHYILSSTKAGVSCYRTDCHQLCHQCLASGESSATVEWMMGVGVMIACPSAGCHFQKAKQPHFVRSCRAGKSAVLPLGCCLGPWLSGCSHDSQNCRVLHCT